MRKKFFRNTLQRILEIKSFRLMAASSSIGVLIGTLPLIGLRIPIIIAVSIIFGLNIISITIGLLIANIFPFVHILSMYIYQKLGSLEVPSIPLTFLHVLDNLSISYFEKISIVASVVSHLVFAIICYPIFFWIYKLFIKKNVDNFVGDKTFIFQDKGGKRLPITKMFVAAIITVAVIVGAMFSISITMTPNLPDMGIKKIHGVTDINSFLDKMNYQDTINPKSLAYFNKKHLFNKYTKPNSANFNNKNTDKKVMAFYVSWDEESLKSLKANHNYINIVVPDWYTLNSKLELQSNIRPEVDAFIKSNDIQEMPLISNFVNGKWDSNIVHNLVSTKNRKKIIDNLIKELKVHEYAGFNLDIENIDEADKKTYVGFVKDLYTDMNKNNLKLTIDLPAADDTLDYRTLSKYCDYVIIMMYDEHDEDSKPGSIASLKWSQEVLKDADIPSNKLIGGIGNYGYDWTINSNEPAQSVTYTDVIGYVGTGNINIYWDKNSQTPYLGYTKDGVDHVVWFLDGTTFYNQVKANNDRGTAGIAIWRLGGEDPTIWNVVKNIKEPQKGINDIKHIYCSSGVRYTGSGEILHVESQGENGQRSLTLGSSGYIDDVKYLSMPSDFQIKLFGKATGKTIALTFDDGPDATYTPEILDILKKYNVKASFFIVGENAEVNQDILKRIYDEGHDIGNHSFTHPNIAEISPERTKLELNATQRLIQEVTGHSTIFFRPPYVADAQPSNPNEIIPILRAQELGYIMVGELIDPLDWQLPKPEEIYQRIMNNINDGNIVLLHDGGGNRDSTVKVLPKLIEKLQKDGYSFVTVSQLMNKSRDEVMPPVKKADTQFAAINKELFDAVYDWHSFITLVFCSACALGILRMFLLMYLSNFQKKKTSKRLLSKYEKGVSVVIAAYNEEKVICKTIDSVLQSNFENLEVIVVDDGSKDGTLNILKETYSSNSKVKIFTKANGGKTSALNLAFKSAINEVIVTIDADTILEKDTIELLAAHFNNPKVAAVSGNIKVGNKNNLLTLWQHVEYITGLNLEKRSYEPLNCITVVPGAIGGWRKCAVEECGYFSEDTLAEDTDITMKLLKKGYEIKLEERAKAYTEVPEDVKSLVKQRYRWCYGTLQCLWKHKNVLFNLRYKNRALGFFAMPSMWLFQYVFLTLSPIGDIYFIIGMFGKSPNKILVFYLLFLVIDYISAAFAFNLENESKKPLKWLLLQRIAYRYIMVYAVVKALASALIGKVVGWNKLKRTESVDVKLIN